MKSYINSRLTIIIFILFIIILAYLGVGDSNFGSEISIYAQSNKNTKYKILSLECTDNNCTSITLIDPKYFNRLDLQNIGTTFSEKFKDKSSININIFDDPKIAEAYLNGNKEARELQFDRRGWYFRTNKNEVIIFRPDASEFDKFITINLWKNKH